LWGWDYLAGSDAEAWWLEEKQQLGLGACGGLWVGLVGATGVLTGGYQPRPHRPETAGDVGTLNAARGLGNWLNRRCPGVAEGLTGLMGKPTVVAGSTACDLTREAHRTDLRGMGLRSGGHSVLEPWWCASNPRTRAAGGGVPGDCLRAPGGRWDPRPVILATGTLQGVSGGAHPDSKADEVLPGLPRGAVGAEGMHTACMQTHGGEK
jgi:hypothetical protein